MSKIQLNLFDYHEIWLFDKTKLLDNQYAKGWFCLSCKLKDLSCSTYFNLFVFKLAPTHFNYLQYNQLKMEQTAIIWPIGTHFNIFNLTVHHLQGIQACLNVLWGLIQRAYKYQAYRKLAVTFTRQLFIRKWMMLLGGGGRVLEKLLDM